MFYLSYIGQVLCMVAFVTNMIVPTSGERRSILVDFDWAGKTGEVEYPPNVYHGKELWRLDGAFDGELITADHDIQMLQHLFAS
jgi:hypothetical protein